MCRCITEDNITEDNGCDPEPHASHSEEHGPSRRPRRSIYSPPESSDEERDSGSSSDEERDSGCGRADKAASLVPSLGDPAPTHRPAAPPSEQAFFVCEAVIDLCDGDEALWVYNSHPHDAGWLLGYGFVPEDGTSSPTPTAGCTGGGSNEASVLRIETMLASLASLSHIHEKELSGLKALLVRELGMLLDLKPIQ